MEDAPHAFCEITNSFMLLLCTIPILSACGQFAPRLAKREREAKSFGEPTAVELQVKVFFLQSCAYFLCVLHNAT